MGRAQQRYVAGRTFEGNPADIKPPAKQRPQSLAKIVIPDERGTLYLPNGSAIAVSKEFKSHRGLSPGRAASLTPREAATLARAHLSEVAGKLPNLPQGDSIIMKYVYQPDPLVQQAMATELLRPGSPVREVHFGTRVWRPDSLDKPRGSEH